MPNTNRTQFTGGIPEWPDAEQHRGDPCYEPATAALAHAEATPSVDLRAEAFMPRPWPVWNQGLTDMCTAFAVAAALEFHFRKHGEGTPIVPSRCYLYYWELRLPSYRSHAVSLVGEKDGWVSHPRTMRDAIEAARKRGSIQAGMWCAPGSGTGTVDQDDWSFTGPPTDEMLAFARKHREFEHAYLNPSVRDLEACLADGYPVTIMIQLSAAFEQARDPATGGVIHDSPGDMMPGLYHALLLIGYERERGRFLFRNSEGAGWGDEGYGWLPYSWIQPPGGITSSFWTLRPTGP